MGLFVLGLAALNLQGRGIAALGAPEGAALSPAAGISADTLEPPVPTTAAEPPALASTAATDIPPSAIERNGNDDDNGFSRRRRRRNRYWADAPGPEDWAPPEGPVRIALQAGHWKSMEAPNELSGLRGNGANGGGKAEWEVNLAIAERTAALLEGMGYLVDVLPATVPPQYRAHLFISIHADGATDPNATGYRVAAPRGDATGRADYFVDILEETYGEVTGLRRIPTLTRRMENYYAFNFRRYQHALHPMTIGVILETGFLSSASDRRLIVNDPDRVARAIARAVVAYPVTPPPDAGAARTLLAAGSTPGR